MWRIAVCFAACTPAAPPAAPAIAPSLFVVRDAAFGPLTARTPATLVALRAALAGFEVAPIHAEGLEYRVSQAGAPVFAIVPADDGTLLNIHVTSPTLDVGGLRVGTPYRGGADTCECWGDQTVCFRAGAHVAVSLAKICREGTRAAPPALAGTAIRTTIWSPRALAAGGVGPPDASR